MLPPLSVASEDREGRREGGRGEIDEETEERIKHVHVEYTVY